MERLLTLSDLESGVHWGGVDILAIDDAAPPTTWPKCKHGVKQMATRKLSERQVSGWDRAIEEAKRQIEN